MEGRNSFRPKLRYELSQGRPEGPGAGPNRSNPVARPVVFKYVFYFYVGCPLPGEGRDGHLPSKIDSVGSVSVRIRGVI